MSSISWLENDIFLVAHTPSNFDSGMAPVTKYHVITRAKSAEKQAVFQKLPEASPPFGLNRYPPFQFMLRLKDFPPNLSDAIIVASTASTDIGLITRSKTPLTNHAPAEKIINVFTTTTMAEDSRRAQLPLTEDLRDTSPIGVAFDLSSTSKIKRPLPQEEFEESPSPLPALMVLNNEGLLSTWWIVYTESIRQGSCFPGLTVATGLLPQQQSQTQRQQSSPSPPNFGQNSFGKPSTPLGAFGNTSSMPAFPALGSTSTPGPAFGAPTGLGQQKPLWGGTPSNATGAQTSTSVFGQQSFGSSTSMMSTTQGTAFGMVGGLGHKTSPWDAPPSATVESSTQAFGQPSKLGLQTSPFGSTMGGSSFGSNVAASNPSAPSGGFASFASKSGGFLSAAPSSGGISSSFGGSPPVAPFATEINSASPFGQQQDKGEPAKSAFGGVGGGFQLGSTFKSDGTAASDGPRTTGDAAGSMFGNNFGSMLGEAVAPQTRDAEMDDEDGGSPSAEQKKTEHLSAEPVIPNILFPKTDPPKSGGLFGTQSQSMTTPAEVQSSRPAGFTFDKPATVPEASQEISKSSKDQSKSSIDTSPNIKEEPQSEDDNISPLNEEELQPPEGYGSTDSETSSSSKSPETPGPEQKQHADTPLPPESTSKTSYAPGDSSNSSKSSDDAPLPPDFAPSKTKLKEVEPASPEQAKIPSDNEDGALDDEGSGVDVAQDISPSVSNQSAKFTPDSSFGLPVNKSPPGGLFSGMPKQSDKQGGKNTLFGELDQTSVPFFPPPTKTQQSPRSPSPIRLISTTDSLRPENSRSISAPVPFKAPNNRQNQPSRFAVPFKVQRSAEDLRNEERERMLAEQSRRAAEEQQELVDDDDVQTRTLLDSDVTGSKILDPFLAHQDYVGSIDKPGIPGQIEKVFRDINSMIDTLGLNARSLTAFIKGHEEQAKPTDRTRDDFEDIDDWCLVEVHDLSVIESQLSEQLEYGKLQDVPGKLKSIHSLHKDLSHIQRKSHDLGRTIDLRKEPSSEIIAAQAPLSFDQRTQQSDLRKAFKRFQDQLAQAERGVSELRAKVAFAEAQVKGPKRNGAEALKQPTVEAVQSTIRKMTAMVQKKNMDIDALETEMRNLQFSTHCTNGAIEDGTPGRSREGTASAGSNYKKPWWDSYEAFSPAAAAHRESPLRRALNGDGTPRKGPNGLSAEDMEGSRAKARRRRDINGAVKDIFGQGKPRTRALD